MWVLRSLLIALIVVSSSAAQESGDRSAAQEMGVNKIEVADISEPNAVEIERASNGDQKSLAALEAVNEGNELWRAGEVEQSSASYQRAINLDPSMYSAQFNLGVTLLHRKQYRRAVLAFTEALRLTPESAVAWQSLGFAHYYGKHYHDAVEAFRKAQQLSPDEAVASSNLGFAYLYVRRLQDAIISFRNALQLDSRFPYAINGLCIAHALAKQPGDAVVACLRAAAGDPDSAAPHYFLGVAYMASLTWSLVRLKKH
jgi:protein O-GlcNAc transferase